MIKRNNERLIEEVKGMKDGPGTTIFKLIATPEETYDKARIFKTITLNQNCGIGYHEHVDEEEIYIINKGKGKYNEDGTDYDVYEGDVTICYAGHGHAMTNVEKEPLEYTAIIIKK